MFKKWLVLILLCCVAYPVAAQGQDSPFQLVDEAPVVSHGLNASDWDNPYTDPGAVFYHDGQFHMFRNGFRGWPASVQIGYLTSPDGITWTEMSEEPVLTTDEIPYAGVAALASSALVEEDGTWVLYFYTWETSEPLNSRGAIGRATASDPLGPWTVDPEPILQPGGADAWDSRQVLSPRVVRDANGYWMYYSGNTSGFTFSGIGLATSQDGVTWVKHDDPATDGLFAESDPVIAQMEGALPPHQPAVVISPEGFVMVYRTADRVARQRFLHLAHSQDGITWEANPETPIWDDNRIPNSNEFWFTALTYHDNTYYLYIEARLTSPTDIYLATATGNLFGE